VNTRMSFNPLRRFYTFVLKKLIGDYLQDELHHSKVEVQLSNGILELTDIQLDVEALNETISGLPFEVVQAKVGLIHAEIPWHSLSTKNCKIILKQLEVIVKPLKEADAESQCLSKSFLAEASKIALEEDDTISFVKKHVRAKSAAAEPIRSGNVEEEDSGAVHGMQVIGARLRQVLEKTEFEIEGCSFAFHFPQDDADGPEHDDYKQSTTRGTSHPTSIGTSTAAVIVRFKRGEYVNTAATTNHDEKEPDMSSSGDNSARVRSPHHTKEIRLAGLQVDVTNDIHLERPISVAHGEVDKYCVFGLTPPPIAPEEGNEEKVWDRKLHIKGSVPPLRALLGGRQTALLISALKQMGTSSRILQTAMRKLREEEEEKNKYKQSYLQHATNTIPAAGAGQTGTATMMTATNDGISTAAGAVATAGALATTFDGGATSNIVRAPPPLGREESTESGLDDLFDIARGNNHKTNHSARGLQIGQSNAVRRGDSLFGNGGRPINDYKTVERLLSQYTPPTLPAREGGQDQLASSSYLAESFMTATSHGTDTSEQFFDCNAGSMQQTAIVRGSRSNSEDGKQRSNIGCVDTKMQRTSMDGRKAAGGSGDNTNPGGKSGSTAAVSWSLELHVRLISVIFLQRDVSCSDWPKDTDWVLSSLPTMMGGGKEEHEGAHRSKPASTSSSHRTSASHSLIHQHPAPSIFALGVDHFVASVDELHVDIQQQFLLPPRWSMSLVTVKLLEYLQEKQDDNWGRGGRSSTTTTTDKKTKENVEEPEREGKLRSRSGGTPPFDRRRGELIRSRHGNFRATIIAEFDEAPTARRRRKKKTRAKRNHDHGDDDEEGDQKQHHHHHHVVGDNRKDEERKLGCDTEDEEEDASDLGDAEGKGRRGQRMYEVGNGAENNLHGRRSDLLLGPPHGLERKLLRTKRRLNPDMYVAARPEPVAAAAAATSESSSGFMVPPLLRSDSSNASVLRPRHRTNIEVRARTLLLNMDVGSIQRLVALQKKLLQQDGRREGSGGGEDADDTNSMYDGKYHHSYPRHLYDSREERDQPWREEEAEDGGAISPSSSIDEGEGGDHFSLDLDDFRREQVHIFPHRQHPNGQQQVQPNADNRPNTPVSISIPSIVLYLLPERVQEGGQQPPPADSPLSAKMSDRFRIQFMSLSVSNYERNWGGQDDWAGSQRTSPPPRALWEISFSSMEAGIVCARPSSLRPSVSSSSLGFERLLDADSLRVKLVSRVRRKRRNSPFHNDDDDDDDTDVFHPFLAPGTKVSARETEAFFQRLWDPYRVWEEQPPPQSSTNTNNNNNNNTDAAARGQRSRDTKYSSKHHHQHQREQAPPPPSNHHTRRPLRARRGGGGGGLGRGAYRKTSSHRHSPPLQQQQQQQQQMKSLLTFERSCEGRAGFVIHTAVKSCRATLTRRNYVRLLTTLKGVLASFNANTNHNDDDDDRRRTRTRHRPINDNSNERNEHRASSTGDSSSYHHHHSIKGNDGGRNNNSDDKNDPGLMPEHPNHVPRAPPCGVPSMIHVNVPRKRLLASHQHGSSFSLNVHTFHLDIIEEQQEEEDGEFEEEEQDEKGDDDDDEKKRSTAPPPRPQRALLSGFSLTVFGLRHFNLSRFNCEETNYTSLSLAKLHLSSATFDPITFQQQSHTPILVSNNAATTALNGEKRRGGGGGRGIKGGGGQGASMKSHVAQFVHVVTKKKDDNKKMVMPQQQTINQMALNFNSAALRMSDLNLFSEWVSRFQAYFVLERRDEEGEEEAVEEEHLEGKEQKHRKGEKTAENKRAKSVSQSSSFLYVHATDCAVEYRPPTCRAAIAGGRGLVVFSRVSGRLSRDTSSPSSPMHLSIDLNDLTGCIKKHVPIATTSRKMKQGRKEEEEGGEQESLVNTGATGNHPPALYSSSSSSFYPNMIDRKDYIRVATIDAFQLGVQTLPKDDSNRALLLKNNPLMPDVMVELSRGVLSVQFCPDSFSVLSSLAGYAITELTPAQAPRDVEISFPTTAEGGGGYQHCWKLPPSPKQQW